MSKLFRSMSSKGVKRRGKMRRELIKSSSVPKKYKEPETPCSICECGHTGDGKNSQHKSNILAEITGSNYGHQSCKMCDCRQFRWKAFIEKKQ